MIVKFTIGYVPAKNDQKWLLSVSESREFFDQPPQSSYPNEWNQLPIPLPQSSPLTDQRFDLTMVKLETRGGIAHDTIFYYLAIFIEQIDKLRQPTSQTLDYGQ